jgi:hypothetical protein
VGCVSLVVDAKTGAVEFYGRCGFEPVGLVEGHKSPAPPPRSSHCLPCQSGAETDITAGKMDLDAIKFRPREAYLGERRRN